MCSKKARNEHKWHNNGWQKYQALECAKSVITEQIELVAREPLIPDTNGVELRYWSLPYHSAPMHSNLLTRTVLIFQLLAYIKMKRFALNWKLWLAFMSYLRLGLQALRDLS